MVEIRQGERQDADALGPLILLSASKLLPYIFGSEQQTLAYISLASKQTDGQYSATRHHLAVDGRNVIGCMTLWHDKMPSTFHKATLQSISDFLSKEQLTHIIQINAALQEIFLPPSADELCVGHLAVALDWQGKQVGSKLLAFALAIAEQLGKRFLVLDVDVQNQAAVIFYTKYGFVSVKEQAFAPTQQRFSRMQRAIA